MKALRHVLIALVAIFTLNLTTALAQTTIGQVVDTVKHGGVTYEMVATTLPELQATGNRVTYPDILFTAKKKGLEIIPLHLVEMVTKKINLKGDLVVYLATMPFTIPGDDNVLYIHTAYELSDHGSGGDLYIADGYEAVGILLDSDKVCDKSPFMTMKEHRLSGDIACVNGCESIIWIWRKLIFLRPMPS